ncbi:MAG TPA: dihydrolipoyl dehydrogenase [Myxococcota bacterium]|nr:dihydrolipoyl dehydrogenase [Myxococcota bacterium]
MPETSFDVIVIGAGPGGYPAAIRAAQLGLRTACVEREKLGGVCLNWGCIPSKALLKTAELANKMRHAADFGLQIGPVAVDYPRVIARSREVSARFERGVAGLFKKYGVTSIPGSARLTAPGTVVVDGPDGERTLTAGHVIVATGARARTFPAMQPDGERILTYREAIVLAEQPPSVIILGAGAIGMEFAYFWSGMGTQVTLVEGMDEVLPIEDRELGREVHKAYTKAGIAVRTGARIEGVRRDGDGCVVTVAGDEELRAHTVLLALGISPNTAGLGLEELGVKLDKRGLIEVDSSHRTSAPGVYAVGDCCNGGPALAHVATRQAHVCVERIAGRHAPDVDYTAMPSCTYCQPQVASVGMTEEQVKAKGLAYKVGRFPFQANGRSQGAGTPDGFVKVLVDPKHGEILGAHVVGADATELIAEMTLARAAELDAETILHTMHAHPTAAEALMEAVGVALGESVHW